MCGSGDRANIVSVFKQVGGEGMPKRVAARRFKNARGAKCVFDGFLRNRFIAMVAPNYIGTGVDRSLRGRENILPTPLFARAGIFAFQCIGQIHLAETFLSIRVMQRLYAH
jgi:hypothetical protein